MLGSNHLGLAKLYSRMAHSFISSNNQERKPLKVEKNFEKAEYFVDKAISIAGNQKDSQGGN